MLLFSGRRLDQLRIGNHLDAVGGSTPGTLIGLAGFDEALKLLSAIVAIEVKSHSVPVDRKNEIRVFHKIIETDKT